MAAEQRTSLIRTGLIAFVVLIALFLAYRSAHKARKEVATPIDIGAIAAAPVDRASPASPSPSSPTGASTDTQVLEAAASRSDAALEELSTLADRRPEDVAQILQGWLADETAAR